MYFCSVIKAEQESARRSIYRHSGKHRFHSADKSRHNIKNQSNRSHYINTGYVSNIYHIYD